MRAILVVLCAAILCAIEGKPKERGFLTFTKVPHNDPEYKAIILKALDVMGQPTYGFKMLSLYEKMQVNGYGYKFTYRRNDGKLCFMRWTVIAVFGKIEGEPPTCKRSTLENKTSQNSLSSNIKFLLGLKKACDERRREQFKQLQNLIYTFPDDDGVRNFCPATFDGWSCWNTTPSGETALAPCPYFVTGFDQSRFAFRKCLTNGSWFRHPDTGQPWSNYTTCIDMEDLEFRKIVNTIYVVGYYISFAALVASLVIFLTFRSLRCTRIAIHVHLFSSFAANNLMWIIWYKLVVGNTTVVQENQVFCQVMHVILQYLMVANYMWMFCEGLHLHLALVVVFVKDDSALRWFYFIGWLLPAILTVLYAVVRSSYPDDTRECWMNDSHTQWILIVPVCLSMLASLGFLINVVRVLLTKLHCNSANPAPIGLKKAVRAAFILIPLFGIHHILIPFRPEPDEPGEKAYQIFSALLVSLQGFCVSILFCFANVDVHCAFKTTIRRMRRRAADTGNITGTMTREVA